MQKTLKFACFLLIFLKILRFFVCFKCFSHLDKIIKKYFFCDKNAVI